MYHLTEKRFRLIDLFIMICIRNVLAGELYHILINVHTTTGNGAPSVVGTKLVGLRSKPVHFLSRFGGSPSLSESDLDLAEEYLVRVYNGTRSKTNAATFNQLCYGSQVSSTVAALDKLLPTSSAVCQHFKRLFFVTHQDITLLKLTIVPFDPNMDGPS